MVTLSGYLRHLATRLFAPSRLLKRTYETFRRLLESDQRSHALLGQLESFYHDEKRGDFYAIQKIYEEFQSAVAEMVVHLDAMAPRSYSELFPILRRLDSAVRAAGLRLDRPDVSPPFALALEKIPSQAESLAGGKAAHLSRIASQLNLPVPRGVVITTRAFNAF